MAIDESAGLDNGIGHNAHMIPTVREAHDAGHHRVLLQDPSNEDARLDIALDESFPTSDAPGHARSGTSDPAPSSGYDDKAETGILRQRKLKAAMRSAGKIGLPLIAAGALIGYVGLRLLAGANIEAINSSQASSKL